MESEDSIQFLGEFPPDNPENPQLEAGINQVQVGFGPLNIPQPNFDQVAAQNQAAMVQPDPGVPLNVQINEINVQLDTLFDRLATIEVKIIAIEAQFRRWERFFERLANNGHAAIPYYQDGADPENGPDPQQE